MPTVTPFPTLTAFPTPVGTPMVNLAPAMAQLEAGAIGPQVVQMWQTYIGPLWGPISAALAVILIMSIFFAFYVQFKGEGSS